MKSFCLTLLLCSCATSGAARRQTSPTLTVANRPFTISLRHGTADERATETQLERLAARYDLTPWLYTRAIVIDEETIPHSHPVLTLHARPLRDDLLLLSTFIHEQSHWYIAAHQSDVDTAAGELRALAPALPVGFPEGADTETSSYEHLMVIALEERGLRRLVGELAAHDVMAFWATDHYRALYRFVVEHRADVWRVMNAHGLASPPS